MGILNTASDGLPSVLVALVRTLRSQRPMSRDELLALCCPPSLGEHAAGSSGKGSQTLARWTQLGLFSEAGDLLELHPDAQSLPTDQFGELKGLGTILRRLVLMPEHNGALNQEGGALAADLTLALSWALAQDLYSLPGGPYRDVSPIETAQFPSAPYAFRNDTRWNGFKAWVPLLGFGWTESAGRTAALVLDPSPAIEDALPSLFKEASEMPVGRLARLLAEALPVLDGGTYRRAVEERLAPAAWRPPRDHELSVSLSMALARLQAVGVLELRSLADAPKQTLLGRGDRELQQVSHVIFRGVSDA